MRPSLRTPLLLTTLLLGLPACGGDDDGRVDAAPLADGGGPDGGTLDGAQADAAAPDGGASTCSPACGRGHRCQAGTCEPHDSFTISLSEIDSDRTGTRTRSAGLRACALDAAAFDQPAPTPIAEEGDCRVFAGPKPTGTVMNEELRSAGTIVVTSAALTADPSAGGPVTMSPSTDPASPCYTVSASGFKDVFAPGEPVTLDLAGGPDVPATTITVEGTAQPITPLASVTRGQPIQLTWANPTPGLLNVAIQTANATDFVTVSCITEDDGSLTIPGTLTQHLRSDVTTANVGLFRHRDLHLEPEGASTVIDVRVTSSHLPLVTYTP